MEGTALRNKGMYNAAHCVELWEGIYPEDEADYAEAQANCRLIEAAPRLYEACLVVMQIAEDGDTGADFDRVVNAMQIAASAIRKAEGKERV